MKGELPFFFKVYILCRSLFGAYLTDFSSDSKLCSHSSLSSELLHQIDLEETWQLSSISCSPPSLTKIGFIIHSAINHRQVDQVDL